MWKFANTLKGTHSSDPKCQCGCVLSAFGGDSSRNLGSHEHTGLPCPSNAAASPMATAQGWRHRAVGRRDADLRFCIGIGLGGGARHAVRARQSLRDDVGRVRAPRRRHCASSEVELEGIRSRGSGAPVPGFPGPPAQCQRGAPAAAYSKFSAQSRTCTTKN